MSIYSSVYSKPYRSRRGRIFGVCRGLAEHLGFSVFWTRFLVVVAALMTGWLFSPVVIGYLILAVLMKPEPVLRLDTGEDAEFYNSYAGSRAMALQRLKNSYESLNRRIQRMENTVTARDWDWDRRLNEGR